MKRTLVSKLDLEISWLGRIVHSFWRIGSNHSTHYVVQQTTCEYYASVIGGVIASLVFGFVCGMAFYAAAYQASSPESGPIATLVITLLMTFILYGMWAVEADTNDGWPRKSRDFLIRTLTPVFRMFFSPVVSSARAVAVRLHNYNEERQLRKGKPQKAKPSYLSTVLASWRERTCVPLVIIQDWHQASGHLRDLRQEAWRTFYEALDSELTSLKRTTPEKLKNPTSVACPDGSVVNPANVFVQIRLGSDVYARWSAPLRDKKDSQPPGEVIDASTGNITSLIPVWAWTGCNSTQSEEYAPVLDPALNPGAVRISIYVHKCRWTEGPDGEDLMTKEELLYSAHSEPEGFGNILDGYLQEYREALEVLDSF